MNRYYITARDENGERHQLAGTWEAETPEAAIAAMLRESGAEDDGQWEAHIVASDGDVIS